MFPPLAHQPKRIHAFNVTGTPTVPRTCRQNLPQTRSLVCQVQRFAQLQFQVKCQLSLRMHTNLRQSNLWERTKHWQVSTASWDVNDCASVRQRYSLGNASSAQYFWAARVCRSQTFLKWNPTSPSWCALLTAK